MSRCTVVGGDFFADLPSGGDLHVLKWIIHDWDDERSLAILRNCRRALHPQGRLLVMEHVMPAGLAGPSNEFYEAATGDAHMFVITGGRERTEAQFRALLSDAGFRLGRVIPTESPLSLIEAAPA